MTTAIAVNEKTEVNSSNQLSFSCYVTLSDKEQIIISIEETEGVWSNNGYSLKPTGVVKKYRLEQLRYNTGGGENKEVSLRAIQVRGFRKDGGLKFRDTQFWHLDQKVIDQIPDEYHNYAREAFAREVVILQGKLTNLIKEGVKIEPDN
jgi:hypothetical protein